MVLAEDVGLKVWKCWFAATWLEFTEQGLLPLVPKRYRLRCAPTSFSAGCFCLSAPERRLGHLAWVLRGPWRSEPSASP